MTVVITITYLFGLLMQLSNAQISHLLQRQFISSFGAAMGVSSTMAGRYGIREKKRKHLPKVKKIIQLLGCSNLEKGGGIVRIVEREVETAGTEEYVRCRKSWSQGKARLF